MKRYFLKNRITREEAVVEAESAQEACEKAQWLIGNCYVRELGASAAEDMYEFKRLCQG